MMNRCYSSALRPEIRSEDLWRPDWTKSTSRDPKLLWLDKNENRDPELRDLFRRIHQEMSIESLSEYPSTASVYEKLGEVMGLSPGNLMLTPGSDGAIRAMFEVFVQRGDSVLHTVPTFAMYDVYCKMYGAHQILLDYSPSESGPKLSMESILQEVRGRHPKLVCLPNPNSPSGTVFTPEEMQLLIETTAESGAILLIDEAYFPFYEHTCVEYVEQFPHLFVARTFSKAWGLAGLRVGYVVGGKSAMPFVHKVKSMYEVGAFSAHFIERALPHHHEILRSVKRLQEGCDFFLQNMKDLGFKTIPCHGNFLHVAFGKYAAQIHDALSPLALYRRDGGHACLEGFSRFSATTRSCFEPIITAIKKTVEQAS